MGNKHIDPRELTILKRAILFPVFSLSIAFLVFSFPPTVAWAAAPTPPSNLAATEVSSSQINLSWTDNSTDESGFSIERKTGASGTYAVIGSVGSNVTTYSSKNLIQTTTYYYRVRAKSGSTYSAYTDEVSATVLPMNPPSGLATTVVSSSQIDLSWTDNSTDETGFSIERKTGASGTYAVIGSVGSNVTTYSSKNLIQTTTYYYRVRAKSGSTYSTYTEEVSATVLPMNPPSGLTTTVVSSSQIDLSWTDNSTDETGFSIERKTGASGTYSVIGSVGSNVTTYSSKNLIQTMTYYYRVRAKSGSTYSTYTDEVSATVLPMNPPSGLTTTVVSSSQINLSWTDNSTDESGFSIERKTGASGTYAVIGSVGSNVTTYSSKNLIQTTTYYYRVRAKSGSTYSAYTEEVSATALPMNPPSGLTTTVVSSSQIDLSWTDNSNDESGFSIERKTGASGTYAVIGSVGPNVTTYSSKNLIQTMTYYYRVRAKSGSTYSTYTDEVSASTGADITPPTGSVLINSGAAFTNSTTVTLTLSATDIASGVASMQFSNDNAAWLAPEPYATTKSWTLSTGDGAKTVYAKFKDNANNWSNAILSTNAIVLDTTPPLVAITVPVTGFTNNKTPLLSYAVSDGMIVVKLDGIVIPKVSGNNLDSLSDGPHTVRVESTDAADNTGHAEVNFAIDTTPPVVTITSPVVGSTNNNTPLLNYAVSDGTIVVKVDGIVVSKISANNLDALTEGPHTIRVESTDAVNNLGFAEVNITVDTIAPIVSIVSPAPGPMNNRTPLLSYTVSEGMAVVTVDGSIVAKVSGTTLDTLADGPHTMRVESTDMAGNVGFVEITFIITIVDTTPPITSISTNPSSPDGANGWFKTIPTITLTSNESGTTLYRWGTDQYLSTGQKQEWTSGGERLNILGDDVGAWYTLPFSFTFYGAEYSRVFLSSNGLLSFDSGNADPYDAAGLAGRLAIAPLWDDLRTDARQDDDIYVFQPDADSVGFRWQAVTYADNKDANIEIILHRDGRIRFNYAKQSGSLYGTIGISKGDGINYSIAYDGDISSTNNIDSIVFAPNRWTVSTSPVTAMSGENTLYYYSVNVAGNVEATKNQVFKVDATMPVVTIASPLAGFTNNTTPVLSYTLNKVTSTNIVMVDGVTVNKLSGDTLGPLTLGLHTVRVEVTDEAGNTGSTEISFTVVNNSMVVSIASPVSGATNNNTPLLSYTVNYGTVQVKVDGIEGSTASGDNLNTLADGAHTVRVESMDAAGKTVSCEIYFTVDTAPPFTMSLSKFAKIAAGDNHSIAITNDGNLWAWGYMWSGGTGEGSWEFVGLPKAMSMDHAWAEVAAGLSSNLAMKSDGTLWAWGANWYGQLGDGTTEDQFAPYRIGTENNWKSISTSGLHSVALKKDETLWAWGYNVYGQLGDGTTVDEFAPIKIGTDADWVAISAGDYHTVALKSDGTLWAWGNNLYGQFGDGTSNIKYSPVQIGTDADWSAISARGYYTVAIKSNGTLWAWGYNSYGQLGDGTSEIRYSPVQIGSMTDWSAISAGAQHTMALTSYGTLWAWGYNGYGQLGDGTTIDKYAPVQIGMENTWSLITAGGAHSMALKTDGSFWAWGSNGYGQLGDGTWQDSIVPHYNPGSSNALMINDGANSTTSVSVVLTLNARDVTSGLAFMQFSNDGITWSTPEPYATSTNWMLDSKNGTNTVYAIFQDKAGNWSSVYSSSIMLNDVSSPVVSITSPSAGSTQRNTPLLNFMVNKGDAVTTVKVDGVVVNKVSGDTLDALAAGSHIVRVEAVDANGYAGYAEATFTVDSVQPIVSITSPTSGLTKNYKPLLSYTLNKELVTSIVKVDGVVVNKVSGNTLDTLSDGAHTVRVEATDTTDNIGYTEVTFTVDTIAPTVIITSPSPGVWNNNTPVVTYAVSDGAVFVKVDDVVVNKVSGNALDALSNGSHIVRVEATDAANNTGYSKVTFTVDTSSGGGIGGNDYANIYCMGTGTYLVGPSTFTNGIVVPSSNNTVLIASPSDGSTITGPKTIIKGAMDNTIPVMGVIAQVVNSLGTTTYPVAVNGKYFAAQVPLAADSNTLKVIATDQNNVQHQASITVTGVTQTNTVDLYASPNTGIMTLKQNGQTTLDVILSATPSLQNSVASYAWDFNGTGSSELTCYNHANVTVNYQQTGLYLTQVAVMDTAGNTNKDTAIVNVVNSIDIDNICKAIWNNVKNALNSNNIPIALSNIASRSRNTYSDNFNLLQSHLQEIASDMNDVNIVRVKDNAAEYEMRKTEGGVEHAYYVKFVKDEDGVWRLSFY